jgi:DNA mismatch endonuclease, patch repair protein
MIAASSPEISAKMSRHPRRDTGPELGLRRLLHAAGLRYRVQYPVPGMGRRTIDIAFPGRRVAIFVDGCFWHGCADHSHIPASNSEWWQEKFRRNSARDEETDNHLLNSGWHVVRLWEHQTAPEMLSQVRDVLDQAASGASPTKPGRRNI